ncbi:MAG TPA: Ig-like domain-containing protein, partial [Chloroflexota bacterium]|nr:Ig-like domain-containing protein [Chloroflexota bacterium]
MRTRARTITWAAAGAALFGLLLSSGCGSGSGSSATGSSAARGDGRATFTVHWPTRSRLIPAASNSIVITLTRGSLFTTKQTLARPAQGGTATATFAGLPVAALSATATAYPNANGTGTAQATATVTVTTQSGQTAQIGLTMETTITHIDLTPANPTVAVNQALSMVATPRDAANNAVLVFPGNLQWSSGTKADATVTQAGTVSGVQAGQSLISVTEAESHASGSIEVTVTPTGAGSGSTPISVSVMWPARSRSLSGLSSALSAVFTLQSANPSGRDFTFEEDRNSAPAAYTGSYTSTSPALVGTWTTVVNFFTQPGGKGSIVGTASGIVTILSNGTGLDNIATVGAIKTVTVPANQLILAGQAKDLLVSCQDGSGNLIAVTPGSVFWKVLSGQASLAITNGQPQGLVEGSATVTATVDGIVSPVATVLVGPTGYTVVAANDIGLEPLPTGINNLGVAVGYAQEHAYTFSAAGGIQILQPLPGGTQTQAFGINDAGQIAGWSSGTSNGPVVWNNGVPQPLPTLFGNGGIANGINSSGWVVGYCIEPGQSSPAHACLWQVGAVTDLGQGSAKAINSKGQFVGNESSWDALIWNNGSASSLPTPGNIGGLPICINDNGVVGGYLSNGAGCYWDQAGC